MRQRAALSSFSSIRASRSATSSRGVEAGARGRLAHQIGDQQPQEGVALDRRDAGGRGGVRAERLEPFSVTVYTVRSRVLPGSRRASR